MIRKIAILCVTLASLNGCVSLGNNGSTTASAEKAAAAQVAAIEASMLYGPDSIAGLSFIMEGYEYTYLLARLGPPDGKVKQAGPEARFVWVNNPIISDKSVALKNNRSCLLSASLTPDYRIKELNFLRFVPNHCNRLYDELRGVPRVGFSIDVIPSLFDWIAKKDFAFLESRLGAPDGIEDYSGDAKTYLWASNPEIEDKSLALKDKKTCLFKLVKRPDGSFGNTSFAGMDGGFCDLLFQRLVGANAS